MSQTYHITPYPDPIGERPPTTPVLGVCFSGGGSRSLSCTLGQLSALLTLADPLTPSQPLIKRVAYVSSVSGGSWAAVPFTYLPPSIGGKPVADTDILISPQPPNALISGSPSSASPANVSYLAPLSLGRVPGNFNDFNIAKFAWTWMVHYHLDWSWLWITAVGEFVLKGFGLYQAGTQTRLTPSTYFSLSDDYIAAHILPANPSLTTSDFYKPRAGRPTLIVNFNLLQDKAEAPQVPVQATPVSTGLPGASPDGALVGGGACESLGFGTTLAGDATANPLSVTQAGRYSLCDITGCSSAFFAQWLQQHLSPHFRAMEDELAVSPEKLAVAPADIAQTKIRLRSLIEQADAPRARALADSSLPSPKTKAEVYALAARNAPFPVIPQYDYWPIAPKGQPSSTQNYGFTDGGTFDNTGLLGLLARTLGDIKAIAFVNCEQPLAFTPGNTDLIVDEQLALLFGYGAYDSAKNTYPSYGGMSPTQPMSYVQIFDDSQGGGFSGLRQALRQASCAGGSTLGADIAWARQSLVTVANPVAALDAGRKVDVLWVYNNRVDRWQSQILDRTLKADLKSGQASDPSGPLANFPNYSTASQLSLDAEAVNMLAQLSAWTVGQLSNEIAALMNA
ncbi:hypothetical protein F11_02470 [Rhodospirillum rubrum F11]|uniref:PNPLA domain-containing protein n=1 Tax=Rhodospirillum rubrum (strain ATCC 11170 / ATH 1.1.1 / DSM 467 / LMG 4362 / NCIMB 8255 / S1) TaxID=269796 RepID=Q2RX59_RHORT|nr:hypothetical protein [Rhodospirillum rubrum]ABC21286.1 hypothetical protein Rru_A0481 [Rhodospirillum rubrum ATCC 11170]AEO46964.1 hypothetical protein F11_02470 [Rhodospirillum rubrum F11]MBK5952840.1 hypothetical protein [Rhodospirillum rubrum]QXG80971.1 hypothetical protein KUL73_02530 [Rhodospirillum rubrum]HAQ00264.1 hypothetical protein [Rhodospirillum rubrum]